MFLIGASYHPSHLDETEQRRLPLPQEVEFIELGLRDLLEWKKWNYYSHVKLSLHLARTPITEEFKTQKRFIQYLSHFIKDTPNLISIGLHLTGPRYEGIGKYGFSSHYIPTPINESRVCDFVTSLEDAYGLPVWIENANFYSQTSYETLRVWESIQLICLKTKSQVIADLSHLLIDALNVNMKPEVLLGMVPWKKVVEFHLSGIIEGQDGVLHDGHSLPVFKNTWELLLLCLSKLIDPNKIPVVTIEHSEPVWKDQRDLYERDFLKLKELRESLTLHTEKNSMASGKAESYAFNYLKKIIAQRTPHVIEFLKRKSVDYNLIFKEWIVKTTEIQKKRIILSKEEVAPDELESHVIAKESFIEFLKDKFQT